MTAVPTIAEIRAWAMSKPGGHLIPARGAIPHFAILAWNKAHPERPAASNKRYYANQIGRG